MIRTTLTAGAVILAAASAQAAPMSPDSFGGLQLWLQAADLNFDGTTWADSSGNGNDAVPQGVGFAATYGAPAAATLTPGAGVFSGQTIKGVEFAANADDLLVAADLNGNSNTGTWTMLSVFDASGVDAAGSETRPIGLGSQAANGSTGGNLLNQATDNSTRYDNGFNTGAIASGPFKLRRIHRSGTTPRVRSTASGRTLRRSPCRRGMRWRGVVNSKALRKLTKA